MSARKISAKEVLMFAFSKWKVSLAVLTAGISLSPLLYSSQPRGLGFITAMQLLWLPLLAAALGLPVTEGGGVDAFSLAPVSAFGFAMIGIGTLLSLLGHYLLACLIV